MTEHALNFITPNTFEALSHNKVTTDTFDRNHPFEVEHIALADKADCVIIAPATANIIGKLANGIADDMLSTTLLACEGPKLIAPAMNTHMWNNPIVQDNIEKIKKYGYIIIEPLSGHLACGYNGSGKLAEPSVIVDWIINSCAHEKDMQGLKLMVSAGPTCEDLDPVRFLTNRSSGKMGYSIASAAASRGAEVTLVSGPVTLSAPAGVEVVNIRSAADMFREITSRQDEMDIIIKAAAVADYRPASFKDNKIKKKDDGSDLSLPLERTDDILKYLGEHKKEGQFLCGFSMETENMVENSRKKLESKNIDLVAANNVKVEGAGFKGDTNVLTLISHDSEVELPLMSKWEAAHKLLDEIMRLR
jgi:phosphopantothenoylcysteine decarboxylase/phosphopantothenate--cysteine ligase